MVLGEGKGGLFHGAVPAAQMVHRPLVIVLQQRVQGGRGQGESVNGTRVRVPRADLHPAHAVVAQGSDQDATARYPEERRIHVLQAQYTELHFLRLWHSRWRTTSCSCPWTASTNTRSRSGSRTECLPRPVNGRYTLLEHPLGLRICSPRWRRAHSGWRSCLLLRNDDALVTGTE